MIVSINGKLFEEKDANISVLDHGLLLGDGVFETLRTFNGKLFKFDEHYFRLKKSAKKIFLPVPLDKETLKRDIEEVIKANSLNEARVRVTITRGIGPAGLSIECKEQSVIIIVGELKKVSFEEGVKVITYNLERSFPSVKSLSYLPSVVAKAKATSKGAFEAILVDNKGYVREGSFSNLFIVKDGVVITPPSDVLKGITRGIVVEIAKREGISVFEKEITKKELLYADEIFITFTTGGVVPVALVDGVLKKIGDVSKKLIDLYDKETK